MRLPLRLAAIGLVTVLIGAAVAQAETLRVGRPSARGSAGVPLAVGVNHGLFWRQELDLELLEFGGGETAQATTAGRVTALTTQDLLP
jgi:ABC-type nitrate/sulfonate/bicarbonate transport system substrate-binding protein